MSLNLPEVIKNFVSPDLIQKAANYLQESESGVAKAVSAIVPVLLGGMINNTKNEHTANEFANMAKAEAGNSTAPDSFFDTSASHHAGGGFLSSLLGDKLGGMEQSISHFAGIKTGSASSLFSTVSSLALTFLGNHFMQNNMSGADVSNLMQSQQQHVEAAMPAGFSMANTTAHHTHAPGQNVEHAHITDSHVEEEVKGGTGILLPLLLLIMLAAGALYFFNGGCKGTPHEEVATDSTGSRVTVMEPQTSVAPSATQGMLDSTGNFVYNTGGMKTFDLPNNGGRLEVGEYSTEAKLLTFLMGSQAVDTAKGNWFEFTNVTFKTGSSEITDASMLQLKNMVTIAKAFPAARFKVGGYTDNTGNEAKNVTLSKSRAAAVAAEIKKMGAPAESITGSDGYGSQFPVADNATAEGRAQNRRVAVNVKAK